MKYWVFFISALILGLTVGCGSDRHRQGFGLTRIEITLPEDRKADFLNDFRGDVSYSAEIRINGVENQGIISPAGSTSISLYKKSLDCEIEVGDKQDFRLSAQKTDTSLLKSFIGFEYYRRLGLLVPDLEPVVVYLNGELWGLYVKIQKIDKNFFKTNKLKVDLLYKADNGAAFDPVTMLRPNDVFDVKVGDKKNFAPLREIARLLEDVTIPHHQRLLAEMVDADSFRRLLTGMALLNHWDSVSNNFQMYRLQGKKSFRALAWDLDAIWDLETHPYSHGTMTDITSNRLFKYVISLDRDMHFINIRTALQGDFNMTTLDEIASPHIEKMREAYGEDPVLGKAGRNIDSEYARLRSDIQSWWNSLDQELVQRGY